MRKIFIIATILFHLSLFTSHLHAQVGKVGINTTTPQAMLHVKDSSVLFTGVTSSLPASPGNPPASGAGVRMMWYSDKAAFRAGDASNVNWDKDSIGAYSFAGGRGTKALGIYSFAMGTSKATGAYAAALGDNVTASGTKSFATGQTSYARGSFSFAAGQTSFADGNSSVAMGENANAIGDYSTAFSYGHALGNYSFAQGYFSTADGEYSSVFGNRTRAKSYSSFVLGRYNDTTSTDSYNWNTSDPLFIIGNGTGPSNRSNAVTVLKNGNVGLGNNPTPGFRLHVTNSNPNDGGWTEGIVVENISDYANAGEAAISFKNAALAPNKYWITGINQQTSGLAFNYGNFFSSTNTRMVIDTFGKVGIGTINPSAKVHLIHNGTSGGSYNPDAMAIFESNANSYIQLSNPNNSETGILSGSSSTSFKSGIFFRADSTVSIKTFSNDTVSLIVNRDGNTGVRMLNNDKPQATLDVNGAIAMRPYETLEVGNSGLVVALTGGLSYIKVGANGAPSATRALYIGLGVPGQLLVIQCIATGVNGFRVFESGPSGAPMQLATTSIDLLENDTLTVIWDGSKWVELSRSNN
jgi:hypothetical protein